jgi:RNA polymerase sigma factor (sigma-70 family)
MDSATALRRARDGDLEAYETLVARFTAPVHRAAVLLGAGDDAEDVVQEAFVKAYRALGSFRGEPSALRAWFVAIAVNQARNLHRSRRRDAALMLREVATDASRGQAPDDPAEAAVAGERRAELLAALRSLGDKDRDVVVCRFLLDLSEAETARTLGWRLGTVKSRTSRALARLRSAMAPPAAGAGDHTGAEHTGAERIGAEHIGAEHTGAEHPGAEHIGAERPATLPEGGPP